MNHAVPNPVGPPHFFDLPALSGRLGWLMMATDDDRAQFLDGDEGARWADRVQRVLTYVESCQWQRGRPTLSRNRGPEDEQIFGADATYRVEIECPGVHRVTVPDCELLTHAEATRLARTLFTSPGQTCHFHVVNERTGATKDSWTRDG